MRKRISETIFDITHIAQSVAVPDILIPILKSSKYSPVETFARLYLKDLALFKDFEGRRLSNLPHEAQRGLTFTDMLTMRTLDMSLRQRQRKLLYVLMVEYYKLFDKYFDSHDYHPYPHKLDDNECSGILTKEWSKLPVRFTTRTILGRVRTLMIFNTSDKGK